MPSIVAIGTGTFGRGPRHDAIFEKKILGEYHVFLQADSGFQQRDIAVLAVVEQREDGFIVKSADGNSRQTYSWMIVK